MTENTTVLIERVGHGFLVRPVVIIDGMFCLPRNREGWVVFHELGRYGAPAGMRDVDGLCGWLSRHFPEANP